MSKCVDNVRMLQFTNTREADGRECFLDVEGLKDVPFEIKRIFYIFGSDGSLVRGKHANRNHSLYCLIFLGKAKLRLLMKITNIRFMNSIHLTKEFICRRWFGRRCMISAKIPS